MLKIAIVDDAEKDLRVTESAVETYLPGNQVFCFSSLEAFSRHPETFDLALMDIRLEDSMSIDWIKQVKRKTRYVLYTTEIADLAARAMHASVVGYHVKRDGKEALGHMLEEVNEEYFSQVVSIPSGQGEEKLPLSNVTHVIIRNRTRWLYRTMGPPIWLGRISLEELQERYPDVFLRIGRDMLVNASQILGFEGCLVILKNGIKLPVSRRRIAEVKEKEMLLNGWKF